MFGGYIYALKKFHIQKIGHTSDRLWESIVYIRFMSDFARIKKAPMISHQCLSIKAVYSISSQFLQIQVYPASQTY